MCDSGIACHVDPVCVADLGLASKKNRRLLVRVCSVTEVGGIARKARCWAHVR